MMAEKFNIQNREGIFYGEWNEKKFGQTMPNGYGVHICEDFPNQGDRILYFGRVKKGIWEAGTLRLVINERNQTFGVFKILPDEIDGSVYVREVGNRF